MPRKKIFFVVGTEFAVKVFLLTHLNKLSKYFDITVIVNTKNSHFLKQIGLDINIIPLKISRKIHLFSDLSCFVKLIYIFLKERPDFIHSQTPKAGILAMLPGYLCRISVRIHNFTGQVWVNEHGFKRWMLKTFDYLIGHLSPINIVDSHSQRNFLIKERVLCLEKTVVFGSGSISGVDLKKFKRSKKVFIEVRKEILIPEDGFIFIYVGRLNKDKGLLDLAKAFSLIGSKKAYLIIVGPDEGNYTKQIKRLSGKNRERLRLIGFSDKPYRYLAASNVLCLPSYREGFGSIIIEAAAIGLPAIASNIYGIKDAVLQQKTGLLHEPKDLQAIVQFMEFYLSNPKIVTSNGLAAKKRVIEKFDSELLSRYWLDFYLQHR